MNTYIKPFNDLTNLELYNIIRIREEIFVLEQDCVYVDCDQLDPLCEFLYVLDEKDSCDKHDPNYIVGTLRIIPPDVKFSRVGIGRVVVTENARRQGLANRMMEEAIEYIEGKYGWVEIELSAQLAIKDLYKLTGFEVVSDVYLEDGIDHVRMIRPSSKG